MTGALSPVETGTTASEGSPVSDSMSSGDFTVLSRYSRNSARPIPPIKSHEKREQDIARFLGARRAGGDQCGIHHANVARTQSRRDARFLQLLQQPIVELFIRFRVMLQNMVLDQLFGDIVGLGLLFVQRFLQQFHVAARCVEFLFDAFHHCFSRFREILLDFFLLCSQPQDFRKIWAVLIEGFGIQFVEFGLPL